MDLEGAKQYIDTIEWHLKKMEELSLECGLNSHAAAWYSIHSCFVCKYIDMGELAGMILAYFEKNAMKEFKEKMDNEKIT